MNRLLTGAWRSPSLVTGGSTIGLSATDAGQSRSRWSIGIPQTKCPASKDLGIKLFFERMDVAATITLEKAGFWPLFETANARFPFNITTAVRTRTGIEVGMHGVLHKWICASRAVRSNEFGYRK